MSEINGRRLKTFFGTLLALALVFQVVSWVSGIEFGTLAPAYMFTPMIAGTVVVARSDYSFRELGLRVGRVRWLGAAALTGSVVVGLTLLVSLTVPGVQFVPSGAQSLPNGVLGVVLALALTVVIGVTFNAIGAFGEEFGWRGYLLWELAPLGFWKASFVIGVVWGVWHAPSVLTGQHYEGFPYLGMLLMIGITVSLSPLYTYLVKRSKSVFSAVFLHGVFNGSSITIRGFTTADDPVLTHLVVKSIGVVGIVITGSLCVLLFLTVRPTLSRTTLTT